MSAKVRSGGRSALRPRVSSAFELALEESPRRAVSSINVRREDKAVFDVMQAELAYELGRPVHQWDVFTALLAAALEQEGSPLARGLAARAGARGGASRHASTGSRPTSSRSW